MAWEPRIIAFCCNWCSYAGADLAGVSRFQYPPNIRIVRVMCSGRVEPHFILKALQEGADGVLVTGCHPGDCHYISGNDKAEVRVGRVHRILEMLGIDPGRLRLKWISASEGQLFAQTVSDFVDEIRSIGPSTIAHTGGPHIDAPEKPGEDLGYEYCIECNKCASSCPITRVDHDYSPSVNVLITSIADEGDGVGLPRVWDCLTCGMCSQRCPSGVKYEELVKSERARARVEGETGRCAHGEALRIVSDIQCDGGLKQDRLGWIPDDLETSEKGEVLYFTGCLPYFEHALFDDPSEESGLMRIGNDALDTVRSTIAVLNRAGIRPVVLPEERCCGHDALWTGDEEKFKRLAELNIENIRRSGAKVVLLSCAEGYRTLKMDYPRHFGELGFKVLHTSEFFSDMIEEGKLVPSEPVPLVITYQDPCRLGRLAGVFDAPRKVLAAIPDLNIIEVGPSGRDATCCGGPNGWVNCGQQTRRIQFDRFRTATSNGVETIVTACPKCLIHYKCAMSSRLPSELEGIAMEFQDINVLLDLATGGSGRP